MNIDKQNPDYTNLSNINDNNFANLAKLGSPTKAAHG